MIVPKLPSSSPAPAKRDPQTYSVIGAAITVHKELGHGFLESVYQDALSIELTCLGISYTREHPVHIFYRGKPLNSVYRCDLLCFGDLIVELKAIGQLTQIEEAQVIHYLKATRLKKALLLNFGAPSLQYKRFINGPAELFVPAIRKADQNL